MTSVQNKFFCLGVDVLFIAVCTVATEQTNNEQYCMVTQRDIVHQRSQTHIIQYTTQCMYMYMYMYLYMYMYMYMFMYIMPYVPLFLLFLTRVAVESI